MTPSITNQPVFRPVTNREVYMEDLMTAKVAFMDALESRGLKCVSLEEEDKFYDSLGLFLEESFGWPVYASHN